MTDRGARLGSKVRNILDEEQKLKMLRLREMGIAIDCLTVRFGVKRSMVTKTLAEMRKRERAS